jgi:dTDP-4-amino-4,6-dideoxygalactose transaminase
MCFVSEQEGCTSNYWLNAIVLDSLEERDAFLKFSNEAGVMTRPIWRLMTHLDMYKNSQHDGLANSLWLEERVVNIPSSVPDGSLAGLLP